MPSWFRLTDGEFDVRIGARTIYSTQAGVRYYVARLWEDLVAVEPYALEAVPDPIVDVVSDVQRWAATVDDIMERTPGETRPGGALAWWTNRLIDSSYLSKGPECGFLRVDAEVRIIRSVPGGSPEVLCVNSEQFSAEVARFDRRFIDTMAARLDEAESSGLVSPASMETLRLDHDDRARYRSSVAGYVPTDWKAVVRSLEQLSVL